MFYKHVFHSAASIWFEIWGVVDPGKKIRFSRQISRKFGFFQAISQKNSIFSGKFSKSFDFFTVFHKKFRFPDKNWSFKATSWQIIPLLFKSHHCRTYFMYMIRYNNYFSPRPRPPATPTTPCSNSWGSRPPTPRIDAYGSIVAKVAYQTPNT